MNCINGKTLYCRDADEKVVNAFISSKKLTENYLSGTVFVYVLTLQLFISYGILNL